MPKDKDKDNGFTLIELLVVIVILGILSVVVYSAINPVEQIRKSKDTGKKADSAELYSALSRYYTTFQKYPWTTGPNGEVAFGASYLTELEAKKEIIGEFSQRESLSSIFVSVNASNLIHICFEPESSSFKGLANKNIFGEVGTTYICVPE